MRAAFKAVKSNRGAAGIDKVSIKMFEANLDDNLMALMRDLKQRRFTPKPVRRVYIPKSKTELRPLGIPAVRDRVAQEVLRSLLSPIFEPIFHESSYGFRPKRCCHQAIESALALHGNGYQHVLDADIKGFFDNIPHRLIVDTVAEEIADGNILCLIEKFLAAGVMDNGVFKPTNIGTPQGGVLSPLLANIVLNKLDKQLDQAGFRFVRYADDFIVLTKNRRQAEEALAFVKRIMQTLSMQLSKEKTQITTYRKGYSFLGFVISSRSRNMRPKSIEKFTDKIKEITRRKHNFDAEVIEKLNRVIRGTARYFGTKFSTCRSRFINLDAWIRRRLRCMKFKRKSHRDNYRMTVATFNKLGLEKMVNYYQY